MDQNLLAMSDLHAPVRTARPVGDRDVISLTRFAEAELRVARQHRYFVLAVYVAYKQASARRHSDRCSRRLRRCPQLAVKTMRQMPFRMRYVKSWTSTSMILVLLQSEAQTC